MAWSRTLADLVIDVRDRVDIGGFRLRHPDNAIRRKLIESYHAMREWITDAGSIQFVSGPYEIDQTQSVASAEYGCELALVVRTSLTSAFSLSHLYRLEAYYQNRWHPIDRVGIDERLKWSGGHNSTSYPLEYYVQGKGSYMNSALVPSDNIGDTSGALRIVVMPMNGYDTSSPKLRALGVPAIDITDSDSTELTLDTAGFEWLILDAMTKCIIRDNDSASQYQMTINERAAAEARIRKSIQSETKSSVQRGDVFVNRRSRRRETWR